MKKALLILLVQAMVLPAIAQIGSTIPEGLKNIAKPVPNPKDEPMIPVVSPNQTVHSDATLDDIIGMTRYDRQTNRSIENRLYYYPDGSLGAAWMQGFLDAAYTDRGTGYNYFTGSSWGAIPTQRLESVRTGWPSYTPWGPSGEMIVSHRNATSPLVMMTRPVKGTGTWSTKDIPGPPGSSGLDWPRVITNGPDRMNVHMIVVTGTVDLGGSIYQGLDGALVYYRSFDGGDTWEDQGIILPGLTSEYYYGFGGDDYAWGTPHGDTIYFVAGGNWEDTFIMVSYDNGDNWSKIPILNNSMTLVPPNTVTERFACADGSLAVEMDKDGIFHVAFGRMFARGESDGQKYFPYTDGLVYWNSTMPMLNDSLDPDTLELNGQLLGYVYENAAGDTVVATPGYGVGLTSYPQITIDENNRIYVLWCGLTVDQVSGDGYNFRHLYMRASQTSGLTWGEPVDLNDEFIYFMKEFVYPCMAKSSSDDALHLICQTSDQPGSAVADENIPVHDNTIEYRAVLKEDILPVGIPAETGSSGPLVSANFPNPFSGTTWIDVKLSEPADIRITVTGMTGQLLRSTYLGRFSEGIHRLALDGSGLAPGLYGYAVMIGDYRHPGKMVVK